jgi:hypothetical protein
MIKVIPLNKVDKDWLDYTSLTYFMRCPRMYWWRCRQNIVKSAEAVALLNGAAYHDCIAAFHQERLRGVSFEHAVAGAMEVLIDGMKKITIEDPKRNVSVAMDTLGYYFMKWSGDVMTTKAVEVGGAIDLGDFLFIFRIDGLGEGPFGLTVIERKTTTIVGSRWQQRGKPNLQMEGYMFGASVLTGDDYLSGCLDIIPIHENARRREEPFRIFTMRTKDELANWHQNIAEWWKSIKTCITDDYFPMNTESCVPLLGMSCDYTQLCSMYPSMNHESLEIPAEFKQEEWKPFELGGEK